MKNYPVASTLSSCKLANFEVYSSGYMSFLNDLNEAQRAAVLHKEGPLMVIAGAGSGKTRVLTYRIAHLMGQGVDPFNILALTFTNKAAREMKQRIAHMVGNSEARNLWMGTFHSVFARLLRIDGHRLGFPSNFTIYDTQDSQRLISAIIKEMGLDKDVYKYKQIQSRISSFKNSLITVKAYYDNPELMEADAARKNPRMGEIYQQYVDRCFKAGAMDFDDLLLRTNELLSRFPEVLMKYQDRFRYILVDEYQDTNHSQYLIVRALADRYENICVVGDDAQSIYSFRGANISNILNFQKDYDNAAVYRLEQNYRSTRNIVEAANSIISKNKQQLEKVVWTDNEEGDRIKVHKAPTDAEEGRFVARSVFENQMQFQRRARDFAVLYRTNSQSRAIEDALRKKDIPYKIYVGLSFYQRKEIKDVLAYLRLIINPDDEEALVRIINFPARGIGQTTLDKLRVAASKSEKSIFSLMKDLERDHLGLHGGTRRKLSDFVTMMESFQVLKEGLDAFELATEVSKKSGLLREFRKDGTPEGIGRMENIEELLNGIRDFVDENTREEAPTDAPEEPGLQRKPTLEEFLEDVALATDQDTDKGQTDHVALMTVHLAKGLEFPYVYIVGLEEDLFPSALSLNTRSELEEERRLFYVALTRAEKQAYITFAQTRYRWGKLIDAEPSRFIHEIEEKYLDFMTPLNDGYRYKSLLSADLFGEVDKSRLRQQKPVNGTPPAVHRPSDKQLRKLRKIKPVTTQTADRRQGTTIKLNEGDWVIHERFGEGQVLQLEGSGSDKKAEIRFQSGEVKKLLLRFARLELKEDS